MPDRSRIISNALGLIGAAAGGVFGHVLFNWIVRQGFYALIVPGAMLGLGCNLLVRHRSAARGAVCAVAAIGLGLYSNWTFEQVPLDGQFPYILTYLRQLNPVTFVMIGVGCVLAFRLGRDAGYGRPALLEKPSVRAGE